MEQCNARHRWGHCRRFCRTRLRLRADLATATLIESTLSTVVIGSDALSTNSAWRAMVRCIRNLGRPGISSMAISCVDVALWDLRAKLLGVPVIQLLGGAVRDAVDVYGSGGFTSYSDEQLASQLGSWVREMEFEW